MTNEETKPVIPKNAIEEIQRHKWDEKILKRTMTPLFFNTAIYLFYVLILVSFLIIISYGIEIISTIDTNQNYYSALVGVVFTFLIFIVSFYRLLAFKFTRYILDSSKFKIVHDFVDVKPGKFIIETGVLIKKRYVFSANNYTRVTLSQNIIGQYLNFGKIIVHSKENPRRNLLLRNISKPKTAMKYIQDLIYTSNGENLIDPQYFGSGQASPEEEESTS